jgi:hypothetical protein
MLKTNLFFQSTGRLILNFNKIYQAFPRIVFDLKTSQLMKYNDGIYLQTGLSDAGILSKICNKFGWQCPAIKMDIKMYVNGDGIGFRTEIFAFSVRCEFKFDNKKLNCSFQAKVWEAIVEFIGDAVQYVGEAAREVVTKAGAVIKAGWNTGVKVGAKVINGMVAGISEFKGLAKGAWDAARNFLQGRNDWCDCGHTGTLEIYSVQTGERFWLHAMGHHQRVTWKWNTREVHWKCSGQGWQRAYFHDGKRVWGVKFEHHNKCSCHHCWGCGWFCVRCSNCKRSGRIHWETRGDFGLDTALETDVGEEEKEMERNPEYEPDYSLLREDCPQCKNTYRQCEEEARDSCTTGDGDADESCILRTCKNARIADLICEHKHCEKERMDHGGKCENQHNAWITCSAEAEMDGKCGSEDDDDENEKEDCLQAKCEGQYKALMKCYYQMMIADPDPEVSSEAEEKPEMSIGATKKGGQQLMHLLTFLGAFSMLFGVSYIIGKRTKSDTVSLYTAVQDQQ